MQVNRNLGVRVATVAAAVAVLFAITTVFVRGQARQAARTADQRIAALEASVKTLSDRVQTQEDIEAIYRLTRAYGYYVDKAQWSQVAALWAEKDSSVEIAARGVYLGRAGAERLFKASMGRGSEGLRPGQLFNHMLLQGVVNVDPGGNTGHGRWRAWVQIGSAPMDGKPGSAMWSEGTYENVYVKENGVWMFKSMKFWPTFYTPYDKGWGVQVFPNNGADTRNPPDLPKSDNAGVLPDTFVPPYHYPNPVTGRAWTPPAPAGRAGGTPPGR